MAEPETPQQPSSHGDYVPNADEYATARTEWRGGLAADEALRREAVALQVAAEGHRFTYQWEWAGVPIIRLPDDVMVLQELVWDYRPQKIVETGVARGGSMLLDASLMRMAGLEAAVLGIDHKIYPHTRDAMTNHPVAQGVALLEADSSSARASEATSEFLGSSERAILILDSNHTHDHVLAELRALAPLLPAGGYVLVADTLVEEFPEAHFQGRPWGRGNNPLTALRAFLDEHDDFTASPWGRRGLVTEFRDGVLRRIG
jgi:cephalosporin hydroxylase